jgi:alpha-L-rhamnosidase
VWVGADTETRGNWVGTYGSQGYVLFGYDQAGRAPRSQLPPYVAAVTPVFAFNSGQWAAGVDDDRALQDPAAPSGPRNIGWLSTQDGGDPTFPVDVALSAGGTCFQLAAYMVDWDSRGRRQTAALMEWADLRPVSPIQQATSFQQGVWLVWQYNATAGVRLRMSQTRGDNAVLSALAFDACS